MPSTRGSLWNGQTKVALALVLAILVVLIAVRETGNHRAPLREGEVSLDASAPAVAKAVQHGKELAEARCASCHGADLRGKKKEDAAEEVWLGPNITTQGRCSTYTAEDFCTVVREFRRPDSSTLSGPMPAILTTRDLSDDDLRAIWMYSRTTEKPQR